MGKLFDLAPKVAETVIDYVSQKNDSSESEDSQ